MTSYLEKALGEFFAIPVRIVPASAKELGIKLSLANRNSYDFYRASFPSRQQELLLVVGKGKMPANSIIHQYERFRSNSERPILLVVNELKARDRERLIRRKVPVMIPNKFLYAPMLGIVGEMPLIDARWDLAVQKKPLSPWAETILIKRLLEDAFESVSGAELAARLGTTRMTISRALKELEKVDLCRLEKYGKEKKATFEPRQVLWAKVGKILLSPIVAVVDSDEVPPNLPISGDRALEHYSMLVGLPPPTYAISKREFMALKKSGKVFPTRYGEEKFRLELWHRDPRVLAIGGYVDPISLYLSVRTSEDERVQSEARKMISELGLAVADS